MLRPCPDLRTFNLSLAATLGAVSLLGISGQSVRAQIEAVVNFAPPNLESPGNREAGGVRSDTCADTTDATGPLVLVPDTNVGLTTKASPNLFAYVPPTNAERTELRIFDEATGDEVFAGQVALSESSTESDYRYQAAIINIPLATGPVTLESGKSYLWALMVVCNEANRAEDLVVQAVVQHIGEDYLEMLPTDVTKQLAAVDSAATTVQLETYSLAGVWHELLSGLAAFSQEDPELYTETWVGLLTNQGLGAIADMPVYESTLSPL